MSKTAHVLRFAALVAAFFSAAFLFTGCASSEDWVRKSIEEHYYVFGGDYSAIEDLDGLTIDEMVNKLDIYSTYFTPDEYRAELEKNRGHKCGVGISYSETAEGMLVRAVVGGSPAMAAGIKAGDIIVSVSAGGESVSAGGGFGEFISGVDVGSEVLFTLKGGEEIPVKKLSYTASYVSMFTGSSSYTFGYDGDTRSLSVTDGGISELPEFAAYMRLDRFYGNAAEEMRELLSIFSGSGCNTLILDLRGNGGGYASVMADIGGLFTSARYNNAVAMRLIYKDGRRETAACTRYNSGVFPADAKVYVMADRNTASASEALIGILVSYNILDYPDIFLTDCGTGDVKTYGKGIMQSTFINSVTGEALKLTTAGVLWENGKTIHGTGVTPGDGCTAAPAGDDIVNVGYDDELLPVIAKITGNGGKNS